MYNVRDTLKSSDIMMSHSCFDSNIMHPHSHTCTISLFCLIEQSVIFNSRMHSHLYYYPGILLCFEKKTKNRKCTLSLRLIQYPIHDTGFNHCFVHLNKVFLLKSRIIFGIYNFSLTVQNSVDRDCWYLYSV